MKVGGTPLQRAQRLFQCSGKRLAELPASLFAPGAAPAAALLEPARVKRLAAAKQVANVECKVLAVVESLGPVVDDTHGWVEKKLAQNYEELKADIDRQDFDIGGDDSDEQVRTRRVLHGRTWSMFCAPWL
jgi:Replication stress response SDE2 C-terminal